MGNKFGSLTQETTSSMQLCWANWHWKKVYLNGKNAYRRKRKCTIVSNQWKEHKDAQVGRQCKDKETMKGALSLFVVKNYNWLYSVQNKEIQQYTQLWYGNNTEREKTNNFRFILDIKEPKLKNVKIIYTPNDIASDINEKYRVKLNYMKAWRIKEKALEKARGDPN